MGKPDAPTPPDPRATAAASTSTNVATSVANAYLGNINQNTPEGSLQFDQTGDYNWTDPYTGTNITIPRFTATQILSPQQQQIKSQTDAAKYNLAGMANTQSARLAGHLSNPFDMSGAPGMGDVMSLTGQPQAKLEFGDAGPITRTYGDFANERDRIEAGLMERLNPQLAIERSNIDQQLADQGIRAGSTAYAREYDRYGRMANDARLGVIGAAGDEQQRMSQIAGARAAFENAAQSQDFSQQMGRGQFWNTGAAQRFAQAQGAFNAANVNRQQYMNEQFAMRNQPINEITALLSGSQVSHPNFINANMPTIPTTDVAGLINTNFNQQMDIYKQESANSNALMGGLFGLAGGMMRMSDERTKDNVKEIGTVFAVSPDKGKKKKLPVYEYSYKQDPTKARHVGPMAQDVEKVDPDAVADIGGIKFIDEYRLGSILRAA